MHSFSHDTDVQDCQNKKQLPGTQRFDYQQPISSQSDFLLYLHGNCGRVIKVLVDIDREASSLSDSGLLSMRTVSVPEWLPMLSSRPSFKKIVTGH